MHYIALAGKFQSKSDGELLMRNFTTLRLNRVLRIICIKEILVPEVQGWPHCSKLEKIRPNHLKNGHLKMPKNNSFAQISILINLMFSRN